MSTQYGIAKIDVAAITDANVQFVRDTDLGLLFRKHISRNESPGGAVTSLSGSSAGNGYTIGKGKILVQNASSGTGEGLKVMADIIEDDGILISASTCDLTADHQLYQNTLRLAFDKQMEDFGVVGTTFTYARTTATGLPAANIGPGTQPALASTGGTGTAATFDVTVSQGSVTRIAVNALGSGYRIGDVITITKASLDAGFGGTMTFVSDLTFTISDNNVYGGIDASQPITIINSGEGYAAAEDVILSEEGSSFVGTGEVTIGTVSVAENTPGDIDIYPCAIMTTKAGATQAAPETIVVKDMGGNTVVLGGLVTGQIRPFCFSEVTGAGTGPAVGEITIFYR